MGNRSEKAMADSANPRLSVTNIPSQNRRTILTVEDDLTILKNNRTNLLLDGYRVLTAKNLAEARGHLSKESPDAIILDIMLPDGNGLDLLEELRTAGNKTPVIMLTAWGEPQDISKGYRLGATAYLSKPFDYAALLSAIQSVFGAIEQMPASITRGRLTLKVRSMEAHFERGGKPQVTKLSPVEFFLLEMFMDNEGEMLKAEHLYREVWGADMIEDRRAVEKAVSRIRKKIEGSGYTVSTVYGEGYRFERG